MVRLPVLAQIGTGPTDWGKSPSHSVPLYPYPTDLKMICVAGLRIVSEMEGLGVVFCSPKAIITR